MCMIQGTGKIIALRTIKQVFCKANQDELKNYFEITIKTLWLLKPH